MRIDTESSLAPFVSHLSHSQHQLTSGQLKDAFGNQPCLPHIHWLFELKNSDLFLKQWRSTGRRLCEQMVHASGSGAGGGGDSMDVTDSVADSLSGDQLSAYQELKAMGYSSIACKLGLEKKAYDLAGAVDWLLENHAEVEAEEERQKEEAEKARAQAVGDDDPNALDSAEDVILTQAQVCTRLIPMVQEEWQKMADDVRTSSMGIAQLSRIFGMLSEDELEKEIKLIALTATGVVESAGKPWVDAALAKLRDFLLLRQLRMSLSSFLKLRGSDGEFVEATIDGQNRAGTQFDVKFTKGEGQGGADEDHEEAVPAERIRHAARSGKSSGKFQPGDVVEVQHMDLLSDLFAGGAGGVGSDGFVLELVKLKGVLDESWAKQTLESLPSLIDPMRDVFESCSVSQLAFIRQMGQSTSVIKWLLSRPNSQEFENLLEITRPIVDDVKLISAMASLQRVRVLLQNILYHDKPDPPYADMKAFMETFRGQVKTTDADISALVNIHTCSKAMFEVFDKQSKGASLQAVDNLLDIYQRGTFAFCVRDYAEGGGGSSSSSSSSSSSNILSLQLAPGGAQTKMTVEDVNYLMDLRSKLLMLEADTLKSPQLAKDIEETLSEKIDLSDLVEEFTQQLRVLGEMATELEGLFKLGHQKYQLEFSLNQSFTKTGRAVLESELDALRTDAAVWLATAHQARSKYYFLNFFTMLELLELDGLMRGQEAKQVLVVR